MTKQLLICSDLDRTLLPNGPQPESQEARDTFHHLVERPEVTLAYVSGRHKSLVEQAITNYLLPVPDFVVADVGTSIYRVGPDFVWKQDLDWDAAIAQDWQSHTHNELRNLLVDLSMLRLQEISKQGRHKLSFYVPIDLTREPLDALIRSRFETFDIKVSLVWSLDEPAGVGLLDIVPLRATKRGGIEALMTRLRIDENHTVFCGDSGNDIEVLASPIPAVMVANSPPEVQKLAQAMAADVGLLDQLYIAQGDFYNMNGNYGAGVLEGIAHFHPHTLSWMGLTKANRDTK